MTLLTSVLTLLLKGCFAKTITGYFDSPKTSYVKWWRVFSNILTELLQKPLYKALECDKIWNNANFKSASGEQKQLYKYTKKKEN